MANTARYPNDITKLGAYLLISRYKFGGNQFTTDKLFDIGNFSYTEQMQLDGVVALPIPNSMTDSTSAQWNDNYEMSFGKEITRQMAERLGLMDSGIVNTAIRSGARAKGVIWAKANVLNYEGTNTKSYQFQWVMIPQSKIEADNIERICNLFEYGMLSNLEGKDNAYQFYPDLFRIQVVGGNKRMAFLPCVIENVEINMANDGNFQQMADGNLPQYIVSVRFKEITNRVKSTYEAIKTGITI